MCVSDRDHSGVSAKLLHLSLFVSFTLGELPPFSPPFLSFLVQPEAIRLPVILLIPRSHYYGEKAIELEMGGWLLFDIEEVCK